MNLLITTALDWNLSGIFMLVRVHDNYDLSLPALIPSNLLAVWSCLRFTVRSAFDLTFEYVCHPCISDWFWLMVPQLLLVTACNLWNNKLDILGYQLTLLPGHWLTGISPSPDLVVLHLYLATLRNHLI
jgi:hypothetical protein